MAMGSLMKMAGRQRIHRKLGLAWIELVPGVLILFDVR